MGSSRGGLLPLGQRRIVVLCSILFAMFSLPPLSGLVVSFLGSSLPPSLLYLLPESSRSRSFFMRLIQWMGLEGGLSMAVVIGFCYLYRHRVRAALRILGLGLLGDGVVGFVRALSALLLGAEDLDGEASEEDISDMPPLEEDVVETSSVTCTACKTSDRDGVMGACVECRRGDEEEEDVDAREREDRFDEIDQQNHQLSPDATIARMKRNPQDDSKTPKPSWLSKSLPETSLVPCELAPDFYPPKNWRVYDHALGLVPFESHQLWTQNDRNNNNNAAGSCTSQKPNARQVPPVRNMQLSSSGNRMQSTEKGEREPTNVMETQVAHAPNRERRTSSSLQEPAFVIQHYDVN